MTAERDIHELIKDEMRRACDEMQAEVARAIFASSPFEGIVRPPPTWRDRLRWRVVAWRTYFYTVWRALRGDALDTPWDGDY